MKPLVVVPAYNEEKNLANVIDGLFKAGFKDIVVIDDGSKDNTGRVAKLSNVKLLTHAVNRGQGAALETGNQWARQNGYDTVIHFDGDNQFEAGDIANALNHLQKNNLDAVLGSRFLGTAEKLPLSKRYFILPLARVVNFFFTKAWLTDAHNGFRILGPRALDAVKIKQSGMAHNSEIIAQLKKNSLRFAEVPIKVRYFHYGQNFSGGVKVVVDLIKSWFV